MSMYLHYEIARAQQHEIEARMMRARHTHDLRTSSRHSHPGVKFRIGGVVASVGVCAAIGTAFAAAAAPGDPRPAHGGNRVSARQFSREIAALERKGFVQYSCTLNGTEMRSPTTGQVVTVSLTR
jgi:hypothetical protein